MATRGPDTTDGSPRRNSTPGGSMSFAMQLGYAADPSAATPTSASWGRSQAAATSVAAAGARHEPISSVARLPAAAITSGEDNHVPVATRDHASAGSH